MDKSTNARMEDGRTNEQTGIAVSIGPSLGTNIHTINSIMYVAVNGIYMERKMGWKSIYYMRARYNLRRHTFEIFF